MRKCELPRIITKMPQIRFSIILWESGILSIIVLADELLRQIKSYMET